MEVLKRVQWQPLIEMIVVLITILGSTIPLYLHTDTKIQNAVNAIQSQVNAIQQEMKDFHGRLCAIEERNRNK